MNNSQDYIPFHGVVECYRDGTHIWTKHNKITYLGRLALLHQLFFRPNHNVETDNKVFVSSSITDYNHKEGAAMFPINDLHVCCFAIGTGKNAEAPVKSTADGTVIPSATSFNDTKLNTIIPFTTFSSQVYKMYEKTLDDKNFYSNCRYYKVENEKVMTAFCNEEDATQKSIDRMGSAFNNDYAYFKRIDKLNPTRHAMLSTVNDDTKIVASYNCGFITMEISIDGSMFINDVTRVGELGLYMGVTDEYDDAKKYWTFKEGTYPILFSHITFPQEQFESGSSKKLNFKYTIYV